MSDSRPPSIAASKPTFKYREVGLGVAYLGMALLGLANLLAGDLLSLLYIAAAIAGFLFLHHRLLGVVTWVGVAVSGGAALAQGQTAAILLIGLGAGVAVIAALRPNPTSTELPNHEIAADPPLVPAPESLAGQDTLPDP